jgi:hypothetical protein
MSIFSIRTAPLSAPTYSSKGKVERSGEVVPARFPVSEKMKAVRQPSASNIFAPSKLARGCLPPPRPVVVYNFKHTSHHRICLQYCLLWIRHPFLHVIIIHARSLMFYVVVIVCEQLYQLWPLLLLAIVTIGVYLVTTIKRDTVEETISPSIGYDDDGIYNVDKIHHSVHLTTTTIFNACSQKSNTFTFICYASTTTSDQISSLITSRLLLLLTFFLHLLLSFALRHSRPAPLLTNSFFSFLAIHHINMYA